MMQISFRSALFSESCGKSVFPSYSDRLFFLPSSLPSQTSQQSPHFLGEPPSPEWDSPHWTKRLWNHRYKIAFIPLLLPLFSLFSHSPQHALTPPNTPSSVTPSQITRPPLILSPSPHAQPQWAALTRPEKQALWLAMTSLTATLLLLCVGLEHLPSKREKRDRAAFHEIGHFLTGLYPDFPWSIHGVSLKNEDEGFVKLQGADTPDLTDQELKQVLIMSHAGEAMERLIYGYSEVMSSQHDRWLNAKDFLTRSFKLALKRPKQLPGFIQFYWQLEKQTQQLLKRFDRKTVETLKNRLLQDKTWDAWDVYGIIEEFGLYPASA